MMNAERTERGRRQPPRAADGQRQTTAVAGPPPPLNPATSPRALIA
jgi:hypothetical protein